MTIVNIVIFGTSYPLYLHFLGYEKYGVWLVLTTVLTFASLGNLGIGTAVMKLVAEEHGRSNTIGVQRYIATAIALLLVSGTIVLAILLIFRNPIVAAFKLDAANKQMVLWLLPYIGVLCIYTFIVQIYEAALSGLGRMDRSNYIRTLSHMIQVATSGTFLALGFGIKSMLFGSIINCIIVNVLTIFCIGKIVHINIWNRANINGVYLKRLFQYGGAVFSGSLINMLLNPFNKLMLSRYLGVAALPVYEIAYTASMRVRGIVETGLRALVPTISYLSANINQIAVDKILAIYRRSMKLIFVFGVPLYLVLIIFSPFILKLWLGGKFVETLPVAFQLMLVGTFLSLLSVPAYYTLMGINKVSSCFVSHIIQSFVNFVAVITMVILFQTLQVQQVILAVILSMGFSALYLTRKIRVVLEIK